MTRRELCGPTLVSIFYTALAGASCGERPTDLPICAAQVASGHALESGPEALPFDVWFGVLLSDFDRKTLLARDPAHDCSRRSLDLAGSLPPEQRSADDLSIIRLDSGDLLVWARVAEFKDGDALGPVGLVRWVESGLEIRGIGPLLAPGAGVQMRLVTAMKGRVLVVESEQCTAGPDACVRESQLMPLVAQRFVPARLLVDGSDAGPARVRYSESREDPLPDGWVRRREIFRALVVVGEEIIIDETLRVKDCDPRAPSTPCAEREVTNNRRHLSLDEAGFSTTASVWDAPHD